jgi:ATP-dependent DNA ligase
MQPMLATRADRVPVCPDWAHEVKWDGIRGHVQSRTSRQTWMA